MNGPKHGLSSFARTSDFRASCPASNNRGKRQ
jgi:hypothetical protein